MATKKVLITGANSYIGTSFENYAKEHYGDNFIIDTIDMKDGSWKDYDFSKYDTIFHVAGIAHADVGNVSEERKQLYYKVNTDLAIDTAKKAKEQGVKQFVYMSSLIVYGESAPYGKQRIITKDTQPEPANFYGDSKWQADKGVRELATDKFKVLVLRPPMIYGKGSKGNYPVLAKLAKKLPIFPNVKNERSMLYIENLCEFLCQVMIKEKSGIFHPQNAEYTRTVSMVEEIRKVQGEKTIKLGILNPFVKLGTFIPGKISGLINKAFGNMIIDQNLSEYDDIDYRKISLKESIERTEGKNNDIKSVCIVNCFDTYEHRVDMVYSFFIKQGYNTKVYTSNYRHFEKCYRNGKKDNYIFFNAKAYKKNLSIARLTSHIKLSKDIFKKVENDRPDLLWVLVPPNSFVKDAGKYKRKNPNSKLIFDLIDMWPETMPISKFKSLPPFMYWKNLRNKNLKFADEIVTECDLYQTILPQNIDRQKVHTIYLAREIKKKNIDSRLNLPKDKISLCYLGSINNIIDISVIKNLISNIKKIRPVELHIIGDGERKEELINSCKDAGADVIIHGKVYDSDEKQKIFDLCHYGLNIMKESVFVGLTMKSMDYFEAGLPIINNIKGDTWDFVDEEKIGINLEENLDYSVFRKYDEEGRSKVRKFYEKAFTIERFEEKIIKVLE